MFSNCVAQFGLCDVTPVDERRTRVTTRYSPLQRLPTNTVLSIRTTREQSKCTYHLPTHADNRDHAIIYRLTETTAIMRSLNLFDSHRRPRSRDHLPTPTDDRDHARSQYTACVTQYEQLALCIYTVEMKWSL